MLGQRLAQALGRAGQALARLPPRLARLTARPAALGFLRLRRLALERAGFGVEHPSCFLELRALGRVARFLRRLLDVLPQLLGLAGRLLLGLVELLLAGLVLRLSRRALVALAVELLLKRLELVGALRQRLELFFLAQLLDQLHRALDVGQHLLIVFAPPRQVVFERALVELLQRFLHPLERLAELG